jgi:hypothetical protein
MSARGADVRGRERIGRAVEHGFYHARQAATRTSTGAASARAPRNRERACRTWRRLSIASNAAGFSDACEPALKNTLRLSRTYRWASRLNEAAVVRMPSAYGVPAKPNSLANLLESKRYGPSLWYSIS